LSFPAWYRLVFHSPTVLPEQKSPAGLLIFINVNPGNIQMKKTGAEIVVDSLCRNRVKTLFGYPGGAVLPILLTGSQSKRRAG
jgi:hypothetical protein